MNKACPTLTKEQWASVAKELEYAYGSAVLLVDGREVTLHVRSIKPRRYAICVYVDGWFKGEWLWGKSAEPAAEARFYPVRTVRLHRLSSLKRRNLERALGKRYVREHYDRTFSHREPWWSTVGGLRRHYETTFASIELVRVGFAAGESLQSTEAPA